VTFKVDLGEFRDAYLAEADELVVAANERLLAIERAAKEGASDPRGVRELFRSLHTLKGLTTMVGVEPVVAITHRVEAVLRASDRAGGVLDGPVLEHLFEAMRAVEARLAAMRRGEAVAAPPAGLLRALEAATPSGRHTPVSSDGPLELDEAIARRLAPFEAEQLRRLAVGHRALRLDFAPSPERAAEGLSIDAVRQRIASIGEIVKVVPLSVPASASAPTGLVFAILVVTTATDAELCAAAGVAATAVATINAHEPAEPPDEDPTSLATVEDDGAADGRSGMVRVDAARVDDALERLSMLLVTRSRLGRAVAELTEAGAPTRELAAVMQEHARQLRDLRGAILRLRMVPFGEVLARLPLVLRAFQRSTQKDVRLLVIDPSDAELDKAVAERVFPALVHLLRNAVDHGIEPQSERLRRGKPPQGTIRVGCIMRTNRQLEITVSDDGGGIDRDVVTRASGQAVTDDRSLLEAICRPGLSTREKATSTSGRGMGMDIVHRIAVRQLGGELDLVSSGAEGTTFRLRIPLTVAVIDAFTVQCGDERFAVPVSTVDEIVEVDPARIVWGPPAGGRALAMIVRRGEAVPLVHLARALGRPLDAETESAALRALVVRRGADIVAFRLDRVLAQQETVVRPLADPLVQVFGVAGSTDLGDGRATLVLDLVSIAGSLDSQRRRSTEHAA
jgi:two-component system, chemotaxis family, sensor kinase CheA